MNGRFLAAASNSYTGQQAPTEWSYPITYTAAPSDASVVAGSTLTDSGAGSQRRWTFDNGQSTGISVLIDAQRWGTVGSTLTELRDDAIVYSHDGAGNPFVYQDTTTDFTGASPLYSMVQQSEDTYGNVTNVSTWDYSTTTPSGTATKSVNTTYNNSCSSP